MAYYLKIENTVNKAVDKMEAINTSRLSIDTLGIQKGILVAKKLTQNCHYPPILLPRIHLKKLKADSQTDIHSIQKVEVI